MLELKAEIKLYGPKRGGLSKPVKNGFRPSFNFGGELVACEVWAAAKEEYVPLNRAFLATVRLPYADQLGWCFSGGESFELNIASQVIGVGKVLRARE